MQGLTLHRLTLMKTKSYKQLKKELLKDKKIKQAYDDISSEFLKINQRKQNQGLTLISGLNPD